MTVDRKTEKYRLFFLLFLLSALILCPACSSGPGSGHLEQGSVVQHRDGNLTVFLNRTGFTTDTAISRTSAFIAYVYKDTSFSEIEHRAAPCNLRFQKDSECSSASDNNCILTCNRNGLQNCTERNRSIIERCEDRLILQRKPVDAIGFSNEPGFFGYDKDSGLYSPPLSTAETAVDSYPSERPPDPEGVTDADIWQCYERSYLNNNTGGYECGLNPSPIRYLDLNSNTYMMRIYAAGSDGLPTRYLLSYNDFQSHNHPVDDGDRFLVYIGIHYRAIQQHELAEYRFLRNSPVFSRPVPVPDLISPRISIKINLQGRSDTVQSLKVKPYSEWFDPLATCRPDTAAETDLIISEIHWAGSETDTGGSVDYSDEFIEIYNRSDKRAVISGWSIDGAGIGSSALLMPSCLFINAGERLVIAEKSSGAFSRVDHTDSSLELADTGEKLSLKDSAGNTEHAIDCSEENGGWAAGSLAAARISMATQLSGTPDCNEYSDTAVSDMTDTSVFKPGYTSDDPGNDGVIATPRY